MCPLERTGYDSRVGENVNGKSTLRLYLQANRRTGWQFEKVTLSGLMIQLIIHFVAK